ncbi:MerR family transcriptional regulator [Octadecabacter sp. 1_MG-2023]|uniref:MerR family transcriptional regulator n=1 Tax=unclassified Octadecabacter TaxID=196158 RepID=UPI001C08FD94|nr:MULTISPECIES: MerR family transcriptional regulator [unclassified Octadecabacter]MBU2993616.1 MerR family transcriptional regulator [Octadecabacter sp. B2R22]MDO6735540.1 MerR family transcriptional regulator [Octadecabacter sp. 1_MG-2023]
MSKSRDAFRTISEVSDALDTPAHVLRFWESKFSQVKPVKRAGGRRYYRPGDLHLLAGIKKLLHEDGMTIKGAQKTLREQGVKHVTAIGADILETIEAQKEEDVVDVTPVEAAPDKPAPVEDAAPVEATSEDDAKPEATPEPEKAQAESKDVGTTNVVSLPPAAEDTKGPALSLNLSASTPAKAQDDEPAADPEPTPVPVVKLDIPSDPSDSDSKAPARIFHLLQKTQADSLSKRAGEIAPLLTRMQKLRDRIETR